MATFSMLLHVRSSHNIAKIYGIYSMNYTLVFVWLCMEYIPWMMTSSNENIFRVTGPSCGEFTGPGEFPTQRPVTQIFDVSFICVWINGSINNREVGDLRRYRAHSDVIVIPWMMLLVLLGYVYHGYITLMSLEHHGIKVLHNCPLRGESTGYWRIPLT